MTHFSPTIRKNLSIPLVLFSFFPFDLNFSMLLKWQPSSSSARWLYKSLLFLTSAVGFLLFFRFVSFFVKFMRTFFAHVACPNWACVRFSDFFFVHCKWICHCRAKKYPYNLVYIFYTIYHNGSTYIQTYSAYISLRLSDAYWNMFEQPRVGAVIDFIHRCRLLTVAISIDFTDLVAPGRPSSTPAPGYPLCYAYWVCDNLWALCVTSDAHFHWPTHTKHTPTHTHTSAQSRIARRAAHPSDVSSVTVVVFLGFLCPSVPSSPTPARRLS